MMGTSARLLRLLGLLQVPRDWTGPALAERLEVDVRTVRRDVDKLRGLGYPVHSTPGTTGGYRLGAGAALPPLLLDDDEAVAVAVGLRTAAGGTVTGIEETSVHALAKLEQVLPHRLRRRVAALGTATATLVGRGPTVDADDLSALAAACRDHERVRFDYTGNDGTETRRVVEPEGIVHTGRRWYLVAWDTARDDWRTFRVDRMRLKLPAGPRFAPRDPPEGGVAAHAQRGISSGAYPYRARIVLQASAEQVAEWVTPASGTVTDLGDGRCELATGAHSLETLAVWIGFFGVDFRVLEPPELVEHLDAAAARYARAAAASRVPGGGDR
ncbi:helix-turn-helix transcriptional regulator [Pseudonocardia sp. HH130630-07]|uniref:helix-turn-helix transcriptional regulator n=1 Tax=Pseudonocardia sp. HH130630-07 TaxID=1690815 RepID=UPI000814EE67|nr:YafY family protein [Pseudonocardia sp. HH130630-07]ANY08052.1 DNA-binding transcriptional regulator [Pseudonocardia sp. HH130630-07]